MGYNANMRAEDLQELVRGLKLLARAIRLQNTNEDSNDVAASAYMTFLNLGTILEERKIKTDQEDNLVDKFTCVKHGKHIPSNNGKYCIICQGDL